MTETQPEKGFLVPIALDVENAIENIISSRLLKSGRVYGVDLTDEEIDLIEKFLQKKYSDVVCISECLKRGITGENADWCAYGRQQAFDALRDYERSKKQKKESR